MSEDNKFLTQLNLAGRYGVWEEKERIDYRKEHIKSQTCDLAFQHYPTFIAAAECCQEISKEFGSVQGQLKTLEEKVPDLLSVCQKFKEKASEVTLTRKRTSLVLAKHTKLLEVLELPQLMETCVRNNHYEEALAIQHLTAKLNKSRSSIPLVASVLDAIQVSLVWMLQQLLSKLKTQIQLPECLRIVGYIRRMGVFSETELRLKFLQSREAHFQTVLGGLQDPDPYSRLCKVIEQTRINIFDTITQYKALFSDEEHLSSPAGFSAMTYRQIFSSWLHRRVQIFVLTLDKSLRSAGIEDQSLESILGQVMYFGQSLGRVGFDFRPQLAPVFTSVILTRAKQSLSTGILALEESLKDPKTVLPTTVAEEKPSTEGNPLDPPSSIVAFCPLAEICNAVIGTVNEFRYCTPLISVIEVPKLVDSFLMEATRILNEYQARIQRDGTDGEQKGSNLMIEKYNSAVIPYCKVCCDAVFPEKVRVNNILLAS